MTDESHLDNKYFIDRNIYNCPFCKRNHVSYSNKGYILFNWSTDKECFAWFILCDSCKHKSMHLTYHNIGAPHYPDQFRDNIVDLDPFFFYSVPTSYFTIDNRIPGVFRDLITEAEGCIRMNYLTGASACTRKTIYELTVKEKAEGDDYETRIKYLKNKFPGIDSELFDILCRIKDMTSDKVHEQSWDKWEQNYLKLFIETIKNILHEIYVVPEEKKGRSSKITKLYEKVLKSKEGNETKREE